MASRCPAHDVTTLIYPIIISALNAALVRVCLKCGADSPQKSNFCGQCGATLDDAAVPGQKEQFKVFGPSRDSRSYRRTQD
jgi:predicted amidophosphoribosyltransferase